MLSRPAQPPTGWSIPSGEAEDRNCRVAPAHLGYGLALRQCCASVRAAMNANACSPGMLREEMARHRSAATTSGSGTAATTRERSAVGGWDQTESTRQTVAGPEHVDTP
eukprot:scaffold5504_cov101-Isochrysis_galbana.AAC.6